MNFADEAQRFGLLLPPRRPTVVLAGTAEEIGRLYPTVDAALKRHRGHRLILAAAPREIVELRRRYSHEIVLALPHPSSAETWQRRLDAALVIGPPMLIKLFGEANVVTSEGVTTPETLAQKLPALGVSTHSAPVLAFLIDLFGGSRIASIVDLRKRLGSPPTIVCLGNGPSSEHPSLADFRDATLFRVNWNWRGRNWMTTPDAVFTADPNIPSFGRRPILVFPTAATGRAILLRHVIAMRPPTTGYVFLDQFVPRPTDLSGAMIPTNGALMVALAAALKPERIVIAGMDLYQHPEGRYPGQAEAIEGYSREHSAEIDLSLIRTALGSFAGEKIILSDNLRRALGQAA